jgi:hypothetical protein
VPPVAVSRCTGLGSGFVNILVYMCAFVVVVLGRARDATTDSPWRYIWDIRVKFWGCFE